mmetsp:Transcript_20457/g.56914  ORF Transcript_20457/g.56914 Transcript_20457/m.56914 type:complete len:266 (-) Transcript_20457:32-829(-)
MAALVEAYGVPDFMQVTPATDPILTTELGCSPWARFRSGWHDIVSANMEWKFVFHTFSMSSGLYAMLVGLRTLVPTLLTRMSSLSAVPTSASQDFICAINSSRPSGVETSATIPVTSNPCDFHSSQHSAMSAWLRLQVNTRHPIWANSSTIAFPIPFVPPVTTAVASGGNCHIGEFVAASTPLDTVLTQYSTSARMATFIVGIIAVIATVGSEARGRSSKRIRMGVQCSLSSSTTHYDLGLIAANCCLHLSPEPFLCWPPLWLLV